MDKKKNGIYYTPDKLAKYLAQPLIDGETIRVFDPAYGEGSLLLAAESVFKDKKLKNSNIELYGCDIHPVNGLLTHLPKANLVESDFFNFKKPVFSNLILTNPPYIKHQSQDKEVIAKYRNEYPELKLLSNSSDLWSYFLVKSVRHLEVGGAIGGIFPWALLQADYAVPLRQWMANNFKSIRVLALKHEYFSDTQERVVLVWLKGFGSPSEHLESSVANNIDENIEYRSVSLDEWTSKKVLFLDKLDIIQLSDKYRRELGFVSFENYANTRIGIVTGANEFFIKERGTAIELGFSQDQMKPILTKVKELPSLIINGGRDLKYLLSISPEDYENHMEFIDQGQLMGLDQRSHCQNRNVWFSIKPKSKPDAFFTYRVSQIPFMILNDSSVYCTNSIHQIYFKEGISENEKKWLVVSLLSVYSQLSLEIVAKTYGRGMLKMEPGSLKEVLVTKGTTKINEDRYRSILLHLSQNNKPKAVLSATELLNIELNIPEELRVCSLNIWNEIQENRIN